MSDITQLLAEIYAYAAKAGLRPSTVARHAVGDGKFVARLEAGGQCLPSTMRKVRRYMAENPPPDPVEETGAAASAGVG